MSSRRLFALVVTLAALAFGCGDSDSNTLGGPALPDDPSELPGAPDDPDQPANPNASTPPPAPTSPGTTGQIEVALSTATPVTDLGTSLDITVTVTPKAGATGQATLTATGVPPGVTATFVPTSVTLATAPVTAKMTLTVPYTTIPSAAGKPSAIVVKVAAGNAAGTANANFKVNPQVTLTIPVNCAALLAAGGGAKTLDTYGGPTFGANAVPLQTQAGNGITFIVKNLDSVAHEIHGNGGFPHGSAKIPAGGTDTKVRVLDPAAADIKASGYIHGEANGTAAGFKVLVNKVP
jgi:hypothetical protein